MLGCMVLHISLFYSSKCAMGGEVWWERWCKMYHSSACTRRGEITGITCATTAIIKRFKRFHAVYVSPARTCNVPNYVGRPKKKMYNRSTKFCTALRRVQWLQRGLSEVQKKKSRTISHYDQVIGLSIWRHTFSVLARRREKERKERKKEQRLTALPCQSQVAVWARR